MNVANNTLVWLFALSGLENVHVVIALTVLSAWTSHDEAMPCLGNQNLSCDDHKISVSLMRCSLNSLSSSLRFVVNVQCCYSARISASVRTYLTAWSVRCHNVGRVSVRVQKEDVRTSWRKI